MEFIRSALAHAGCRILHEPDPSTAPYRFTFETPAGERLGIMVYAFFANSLLTKNRPSDEYRFEIDSLPAKGDTALERDVKLPYTTLLCGIDLSRGLFVGVDPAIHERREAPLTIAYHEPNLRDVLSSGWSAWEFESEEGPIEILVGGHRKYFLAYALFENAAAGLDPGHRHLLAEQFAPANWRLSVTKQ